MIDDDVGRSHKNAIEEKIVGYYVDGKLVVDCWRIKCLSIMVASRTQSLVP